MNNLKFNATLMTSHRNKLGYKPKVEDMLAHLEYFQNKPLINKDHDMTKEPIGRVIEAQLTSIEDGKEAKIEGVVEIFANGCDPKQIEKEILGKGFSPSFQDGDFTLYPQGNQEFTNPIQIEFDAYAASDIQLYFQGKKWAEKLKCPITFIRVRRHAAEGVGVWIAFQVGAYFFKKILDDIGLYEWLRDEFVKLGQANKDGKEIRIRIEGASGPQETPNKVDVYFRGTEGDLQKYFVDPQTINWLKERCNETVQKTEQKAHKIYSFNPQLNNFIEVKLTEIENPSHIIDQYR